jgi:trans-aconitate 2-methyltransferase
VKKSRVPTLRVYHAKVDQRWDPELYQQQHSFVWEFGQEALEWLEPKAGERILDVGCGTGQLTARIAESGAEVVGLDRALEMLEEARRNFPNIRFEHGDAASFTFAEPFDAVFSNAVLHWVRDADAVAACVAHVLKPGGRFVAEFGGKGNVAELVRAAKKAGEALGCRVEHPWYFPGVAEYAGVVEAAGLEALTVALIDRPTKLDGGEGLANWMRMFGEHLLTDVAAAEQNRFYALMEEAARPTLFRDETWWVDYRRLRIKAWKPALRAPDF